MAMNEKLKSRIDEIENLIKSNSKDAHYADSLLQELRLELKKDVPATELNIPSDSVESTVDGGSYVIKECSDGILFHLRGGYDVFVRPRMTALYKHLVYLLRTRERYEELSEEEKGVFDAAFSATVVNMEIPVFMTIDDRHFFELAEKALSCLNELAESALKGELQPETPLENAEFEKAVEAIGALEEENKQSD